MNPSRSEGFQRVPRTSVESFQSNSPIVMTEELETLLQKYGLVSASSYNSTLKFEKEDDDNEKISIAHSNNPKRYKAISYYSKDQKYRLSDHWNSPNIKNPNNWNLEDKNYAYLGKMDIGEIEIIERVPIYRTGEWYYHESNKYLKAQYEKLKKELIHLCSDKYQLSFYNEALDVNEFEIFNNLENFISVKNYTDLYQLIKKETEKSTNKSVNSIFNIIHIEKAIKLFERTLTEDNGLLITNSTRYEKFKNLSEKIKQIAVDDEFLEIFNRLILIEEELQRTQEKDRSLGTSNPNQLGTHAQKTVREMRFRFAENDTNAEK